jgi:hypothetical protein
VPRWIVIAGTRAGIREVDVRSIGHAVTATKLGSRRRVAEPANAAVIGGTVTVVATVWIFAAAHSPVAAVVPAAELGVTFVGGNHAYS